MNEAKMEMEAALFSVHAQEEKGGEQHAKLLAVHVFSFTFSARASQFCCIRAGKQRERRREREGDSKHFAARERRSELKRLASRKQEPSEMGDFGDIDDFNDHAVQGKPIKAYKNGHFENPKGAEIDDIMCIEENDMLFFSTGRSFKAPSSGKGDTQNHADDKFATVVGGYKVTTLLGRGGFGEVRLGIHQLTNDKVALKFILALNHPSIIKLLRVINEPNHVVLVFELLEGGDLFHYLKNLPGGGLSEEVGASVFSQILSGVGYAHNQHICHRDLKLENILLPNCGSISYLAPEVFRGTSNAGPPLDVWSLGVILFAIVCGRLPFEGSDLIGTNRPRENVIRNRIMRCQYKLDGHLSPALSDLVGQMLKLDPNERATIPEIFGHPWVRGTASGCPPMDIAMLPTRDRCEDGEEDLDFAITGNVHVEGRFEFVLKRGSRRISIVEAKRDDIEQGMVRNLMSLEALCDVEGLDVAYGIVTNYLEVGAHD
ncbi:Camk/camkl protein kinase, partial [Globisporangium splendens]